VLSYVEAGAGLGVVTDSVVGPHPDLCFVPLHPEASVPLVLVWQEDADSPPVARFRELLEVWKAAGKLWAPRARGPQGGRKGKGAGSPREKRKR
jgi:DNA-binding transcriptional LysR family regulator